MLVLGVRVARLATSAGQYKGYKAVVASIAGRAAAAAAAPTIASQHRLASSSRNNQETAHTPSAKQQQQQEEQQDEAVPTAAPTIQQQVVRAIPGIVACGAVMELGFAAADQLGQVLLAVQGIEGAGKSPISGIPLAIIMGMLIKNSPLWSRAAPLGPGISFCKDKLLKAGIVCVGAKLSALEVAAVGAAGVPAALAAVSVGLLTVPRLARAFGLPEKMGALIATGTSICGVTAISALSPAIRATQTDTAFAVANVVAFGTINMLLMPYMAHALLPTSEQAGIFLGLAVHDTAQVVGSALTYQQLYADDVAFQAAVVTKLSRNMLLVGVIPYMTWAYADKTNGGNGSNSSSGSSSGAGNKVPGPAAAATAAVGAAGAAASTATTRSALHTVAHNLRKYVPSFVIGFASMSLARSIGDYTLAEAGMAYGLLDKEAWRQVVNTVSGDVGSRVLLGTAMAAVGMSTSFAGLRSVGWKPFAVGLSGAVLVSGTGFAAALALPALAGA